MGEQYGVWPPLLRSMAHGVVACGCGDKPLGGAPPGSRRLLVFQTRQKAPNPEHG